MNNIYDIFNNRKLGLNSLCEGYKVEAFDDLDTAMEALEVMTNESINSLIELQSAMYLEDLVLENMMYEDFDEYEMETVIETTMKERLGELAKKIKTQWKKFQEWFIATAKAIANFFTNGENLVIKNKDRIPEAMSNCDVKVKMHEYNDPTDAIVKTYDLLVDIKNAGAECRSNDEVLKSICAFVESKEDVKRLVRSYFISTDKPIERRISDMDPVDTMNYAGEKKLFLEFINKDRNLIDQGFKEILSLIENDKKNNNNSVSNQVSVFNFAKSLSSVVINTELSCIRKGCSEHTAIIKKALNHSTYHKSK